MFKVVKRDGEVASFNIGKITNAIEKAFKATDKQFNTDIIELLGLRVTADFQNKIKDNKISVEEILEQNKEKAEEKRVKRGEKNERIAAMNSRMTELTKKRQDMMKHMNFYRRSILRGNPSASSMKFAAALKELREATEKRNK